MSKSLIQRYTYGNFTEVPSFSPEADFFLGGPARQRELLAVARTQVALARETNAALRESTAELSASIARELDRQTATLESAIQKGADSVVFAIDELGNQISAELVEIRWQLLQLRSTSDQILDVLKRPRSTEAQELLRQGIRNLVNDKLEEAEDRFSRALDLDNTDYQVLMNLAAIALRKGEAERAQSYFRDAITLPHRLDSSARAEALWSLARLLYAESKYRDAVNRARESLSFNSQPRRLFQYGVYLMLASDGRQGLKTIQEAIREEPKLFVLAALSSDLQAHREEVYKMLSELLEDSFRQLSGERDKLSWHLSEIELLPNIQPAMVDSLSEQLGRIDRVLDEPSYFELRLVLSHALGLQRAVAGTRRLSEAEGEYKQVALYSEELRAKLARLEEVVEGRQKVLDQASEHPVVVGFWSFVGTGILVVVLGVIGLLGTADGMSCLYMFFGPVVGASLLMIWLSDRQSKVRSLVQQMEQVREELRVAQLKLGVALSARQQAFASAVVPEWPIR
jgi:tetratricopeptide (TPR) repeat protein